MDVGKYNTAPDNIKMADKERLFKHDKNPMLIQEQNKNLKKPYLIQIIPIDFQKS